jgi:Ser-tRNA(Ala) deacylase AlaX
MQNCTQLNYLSDPQKHNLNARIIGLNVATNRYAFQTDRTPFYVKGGGQPSDQGWIKVGTETYAIEDVREGADGEVWHYLSEGNFTLQIGAEIELSVDPNLRFQHSAIHTAGELVCAAMKIAGYSFDVVSAIHYVDNASVEFKADINEEERLKVKDVVQEVIRTCIQKGGTVQIQTLNDRQKVIAECGYYPDYIKENEGIRVVKVWGEVYGRPCKGTHLRNINQLKDIIIRKVKSSKGNLQIRYETLV